MLYQNVWAINIILSWGSDVRYSPHLMLIGMYVATTGVAQDPIQEFRNFLYGALSNGLKFTIVVMASPIATSVKT
jgi:hypothetical protein